jgi:membrane-associated phospholipid phosphatase
VDWSIFHWLNESTRGNDGRQDAAEIFNAWAILVLVVSAAVLWVLARPGGSLRWKLATASAALAAVVGLVANLALGKIWYDSRPFVAHPGQTVLLVGHAKNNGFPSDHATVAFAIAFAVLAFSRPLGAVLVVLATAIALDRIFVGVHYPADIAASFLVGLGSALLVTTVGRPYVRWAVRKISRVTDPVIAAARRPLTRS